MKDSTMTTLREWNVKAPWGNISLTSWGNKDGAPIFLVHGRQDCAASFLPVLDLMPREGYHYVGIDLPGSGMSTHLPVGKHSAIKIITVGFDYTSMPSDSNEKGESAQGSSDPAGPGSMVPNNTPQDKEHENILPQLIPELEKMSIELEQCTKLFEKLTIPIETQRSGDDPRMMMKNKKAKSSIFPKFIKCNDHGMGGTCPFAKNPLPESDEKAKASEIMLPGRARHVIEFEMEANQVKKNRSSFGQHFDDDLHGSTTHTKSQKSRGPDKIKLVVKMAKFKPTFAVKVSRARPRRVSNNRRTRSCFCLCMAGSSRNRWPLDCFTDCFRPRRRTNGLRKNPIRDDPQSRGNKANAARHQNARNFPQMPMPGFPMHPFNVLPLPLIYNENFEAGFYEEIGEAFPFPRPNRDDFLYDEENFYEGFYGEPIVFAPVRGAVHISTPRRVRPMPGVKIMRFHYLGAIEVALKHLGWDKFIYMGHSMGSELGLFYDAIYPGKITKMILLDAEPSLRRLQLQDVADYQLNYYDNYYNNYDIENYQYKTYTVSEAKKAVMKARNLTEDKASIVVKRSLIHVKDDLYRFTWGHRLKSLAPLNHPYTYYAALFRNIPPCLLISASKSLNENTKRSTDSKALIRTMETLKNFTHVVVEGDHDVHLSHPERVAPYVKEFLRNNTIVSSKL